jgi:hypothetical protein
MTHPHRARLATAACVVVLAAALGGCAQSSDTTSSGTGAGGAAPPTASTTTQTAPSTTTTSTAGSESVTANPPSGRGTLTVSPATGSPHSMLHFTFTSPQGISSDASDEVSEALSVTGTQKAGCVGLHQQAVPITVGGQPVSVTLGPQQLGGAWCPGTYTARVEVVERPKCGAGMMCPQFIRVAAVIGPVSFKISG